MRKLIQQALLRHTRCQGDFTGADLITFQNGKLQMTGLIDDSDEVAEAIIEGLMDAIHTRDQDVDDDGIGACAGVA